MNIDRIRTHKKLDVFFNCFFPILFGCLIYFFAGKTSIPSLLKNHLADGLWAYAFCSAFLIVWNRKISVFWIGVAFLSAVIFEWLQYLHLIQGNGDAYDVLTYFLLFILAILLNIFFKRTFNY